jgi:FMN phosphatase YigB (HAD superfamily)
VLNEARVIFLLDVDNTLLDNDQFAKDLGERLESSFGAVERARYWEIFGRRREALGLADYLGALQDFRDGLDDNPQLLGMSDFLLEYPFASRLFPGAIEAIAHLRTLGVPVVLSDGDIVFQPRKIQRSGIWTAVEGRVLIYIHKEKVLDHMQQRYPARHYVMVDDKANLLAAMKSVLGARLTTVFVRQGHYAMAAESKSALPAPDMAIERIGDLLNHNLTDFKVRL